MSSMTLPPAALIPARDRIQPQPKRRFNGKDRYRDRSTALSRFKIPPIYRDRPVAFISELLKLRLIVGKNNRRVVVREREGIVWS